MSLNVKQKDKKVLSTSFSDFVNKSSSSEKNRVFNHAIKESLESQSKLIKQAGNS